MEFLACPLCKGPLRAAPEVYSCDRCVRSYPVVCGIPDFRILPDRYISIEDDRRKGERLFAGFRERTFEQMLDRYWSMTPEVAPDLARKFLAHQLAEVDIAAGTLEELPPAASLLDVGCSTGGLLIAAANRFPRVVGVDVAFRWLVVGQVRLREAGVAASLVCANAEYLPFPDNTFGALAANDLVEHVVDPEPVFVECRRVIAPGAPCYFSTNNRYSLLPEPHVGVWGVGWLPAALQPGYVRLASGRPYRNIRLRSRSELERWARAAGFAETALAAAPPSSAPSHLPRAQAWYQRLRRARLTAPLLRSIGPRLQLLCRK